MKMLFAILTVAMLVVVTVTTCSSTSSTSSASINNNLIGAWGKEKEEAYNNDNYRIMEGLIFFDNGTYGQYTVRYLNGNYQSSYNDFGGRYSINDNILMMFSVGRDSEHGHIYTFSISGETFILKDLYSSSEEKGATYKKVKI